MPLPPKIFGIAIDVRRKLYQPRGTTLALYAADDGYTALGVIASHFDLDPNLRMDDAGRAYATILVASAAAFTPDAGFPGLSLADAIDRAVAVKLGAIAYQIEIGAKPRDVREVWRFRCYETGESL